jgi:predicted phage terminase large subunit-like protein
LASKTKKLPKNKKYLEYLELKKRALCQDDFWYYCHTREPDFYTENKKYLVELCDTLQDFYEGKLINPETFKPYYILIIQMPPRHGKTRTLVNFCSWIFGNNRKYKILAAAYNDDYAQDFSKFTRNIIMEKKNVENQIIYADIFPGVRVKKDDKSVKQWALEGSYFSFKGTGEGGGITGKGGNMLICDDLVKSAEEAFNQNLLNKKWLWYTSTWLSRKDKSGINNDTEPLQIICNTPWAKNDVGGRLLTEEAGKYYLFNRPACLDEKKQKMLCNDILSFQDYKDYERIVDPVIFAANYKLERIDVKGLLYGDCFKTYTDIPKDEKGKELAESVKVCIDTADRGADYFCAIFYRTYKALNYVVDVIYTKDPVEITERLTADKIMEHQCRQATIEANAAGRPISVAVKKILEEEYKWFGTIFDTPTQSKNKEARILSNAGAVKENIVMPVNWRDIWPMFYNAVVTFLREGKNVNDDAPDVLTMIVEKGAKGRGHYFIKR